MNTLRIIFNEFVTKLEPTYKEGRGFVRDFDGECPTAEHCRIFICEQYPMEFPDPSQVKLWVDYKQLKRTEEQIESGARELFSLESLWRLTSLFASSLLQMIIIWWRGAHHSAPESRRRSS